jgi:hypothetical protein
MEGSLRPLDGGPTVQTWSRRLGFNDCCWWKADMDRPGSPSSPGTPSTKRRSTARPSAPRKPWWTSSISCSRRASNATVQSASTSRGAQRCRVQVDRRRPMGFSRPWSAACDVPAPRSLLLAWRPRTDDTAPATTRALRSGVARGPGCSVRPSNRRGRTEQGWREPRLKGAALLLAGRR